MKNLTLENIAAACGGSYHGSETDRNREVTDITTDSRKAGEGSLFAAIKGERVDGHSFINQVFEKGALCVLCEKEPELSEGVTGNWILVGSTLQALKDIAEFYRQQLSLRVVGITGSVGKTSTKEAIASVLSEKYCVLKTLGNFNNELGLPLTVFRLREEHEAAVLEMGISDFGEMHRLSKIARPDVCVMTNIGQCHLEFLHDRDGILRAKSEIFDFLAPDGKIVLNGDDDKLSTITEIKGIRPIFFGIESGREIYADEIQPMGLKGISCRIHVGEESFSVVIPIPGYHMVYNGLAATAVGLVMGLTLEEIKNGLEKLEPVSGRFHIIEKNDMTIIDDCYNANPVSMKASIDVLATAEGRKIAVLGDMGELGENEKKLHYEVGEYLAKKEIDVLFCAGELSEEIAKAAQKESKTCEVYYFKTRDALLEQLLPFLKKGDTVLVKASHFMEYPKIVKALTDCQ